MVDPFQVHAVEELGTYSIQLEESVTKQMLYAKVATKIIHNMKGCSKNNAQ